MKKISIITAVAIMSLFAATMPVFAQTDTQQSGTGGGFFGGIMHFLSRMFHPGSQQGQNPNGDRSGSQSAGMMSNISGESSHMMVETARLDGLVHAGKITSTQEQAIITELEKVQAELKAWADSQGINEAYVLGGGLGNGGMMQQNGQQGGPGMMEGQNQESEQGTQSGGKPAHGFMRPQGYNGGGNAPQGQPNRY